VIENAGMRTSRKGTFIQRRFLSPMVLTWQPSPQPDAQLPSKVDRIPIRVGMAEWAELVHERKITG
jgi:hypothetical protein